MSIDMADGVGGNECVIYTKNWIDVALSDGAQQEERTDKLPNRLSLSQSCVRHHLSS